MLKQDNRKSLKKTYLLPALALGDVLLVGKNNQPVAQTDKGDHKIFKPRIVKLMPSKLEG